MNDYAMPMDSQLKSLLELPAQERVRLINELWKSVVAEMPAKELEGNDWPVWKQEEVLKRQQRFRQNPETAVSWEYLQAKLNS